MLVSPGILCVRALSRASMLLHSNTCVRMHLRVKSRSGQRSCFPSCLCAKTPARLFMMARSHSGYGGLQLASISTNARATSPCAMRCESMQNTTLVRAATDECISIWQIWQADRAVLALVSKMLATSLASISAPPPPAPTPPNPKSSAAEIKCWSGRLIFCLLLSFRDIQEP